MNVRFRVSVPDSGPREFEFDRDRITIGRGPTNDVPIDDEHVARRHGELRVEGGSGLWWHDQASGLPTTLQRDGQVLSEIFGDEPQSWELEEGDVVHLGGPDSGVELHILAAEQAREAAPVFVPFGVGEATMDEARIILELTSAFASDPSPGSLLQGFSRLAEQLRVRAKSAALVLLSGREDFHNDTFCVGPDGGACAAPDPFATLSSSWLDHPRVNSRSILALGDHVVLPFGAPDVTSALVVRGPVVSPESLRALASIASRLEPFATMLVERRKLERDHIAVQEENRYFRSRQRRHYLFKELVCQSDAMRRVHGELERFRNDERPVLIAGEAGTGKELLARALHHNGSRADQMILRVSCAEHADESANAELFGSAPHEGAQPRRGVFELARGGTVFLEEIDLLPPMVQAKLCRMLKEGEVRRVGEPMGRPIKARLIASIHRDLDQAVSEGRLRRELYLLLKDQTIEVPPLRERADDILPLAQRFCDLFCARYGLEPTSFSPEAKERLLQYPWPGNVRELQARVESAVLDPRGALITPASLGLGGAR